MWIFSLFFDHLIVEEIGKNDLLNAACLLGCFLFLCAAAVSPAKAAHAASPELAVLFSGISLGLAGAMRPTSLYYLPFFFVGLYLVASNQWRGRALRHGLFRLSVLGGLVLFLTAGFWYVRNLAVLGALADRSATAASMAASLVYNLGNPKLYQASAKSLFFLCSALRRLSCLRTAI